MFLNEMNKKELIPKEVISFHREYFQVIYKINVRTYTSTKHLHPLKVSKLNSILFKWNQSPTNMDELTGVLDN